MTSSAGIMGALAGCGTSMGKFGVSGGSSSSDTRPIDETENEELFAQDGDSADTFGHDVAISGDGSTALVSAPSDEDPNGESGGSAYVFSRGDDSWTQQAKLVADDGETRALFGKDVALSNDGSTAIVGTPWDDRMEYGAAYVFSRTDESWTQEEKFLPHERNSSYEFGESVSLSGDGKIALVGAPYDRNDEGSVHVFSRSGSSWSRETILAADPNYGDKFFGGYTALSKDGTTALIGSTTDKDKGKVYVFTRDGGTWDRQEDLFTANKKEVEDSFGFRVALSADGTTALVGVLNDEDPNGKQAGSTYAFSKGEEGWTQQAKLAADDGDRKDYFGGDVALSGDGSTGVIAAPGDDDPNGKNAGSAYLFSRSGKTWTQQSKLSPDDGNSEDWFGRSLALSNAGHTAIVGAVGDEDPNGKGAGSAYVF